MTKPDSISIHIDADEKRSDLPDVGGTDGKCLKCLGELEIGFGLAGGGYGVYEYCPSCGTVASKTNERDE